MSIVLDGTSGVIVSGNTNTLSGVTVGRGAGSVATNTAVGASALAANTTGDGQTMLGYQAGNSLTTGNNNTALGRLALKSATTPDQNTAVGYASLYLTTTGQYNTSVGGGALQNNTTASNNTAVGYQAGYTVQTGTLNTYLGYQTGYPHVGNYSTFVGALAGKATTSADQNTFVGYAAGYNNTTGSNNTFVGVGGAGYHMTTGSKNTIIGGYSGNQGGLDIRTANNYIVLSDGDGNPRLIGDSSGNINIGANSPNPVADRVNGSSIQVGGGFRSRAGSGFSYFGINVTSGQNIGFYTDNGSTYVAAGTITSNGSTTAYGTGSDYRMKENIQPMQNALATVSQLKPCTYTWKEEFAGTNSNGQGFIAHELAEVCPQAVHGTKDAVDEDGKPIYQGVDTSFLAGMFAAAIQELNAKVDAQAAEIAALKGAA